MKTRNLIRTLFTAIALFVATSMNAQSIDGCWDYETKIEGQHVGIRLFIDNGKGIILTAAEIPNEKVGAVTIALISAPTPIKVANNKVEIDPDPKKVTLKVTEVDWVAPFKAAIKDDPSVEEKLLEEIEKGLQAGTAQMAEDMMFSGEFTIAKCTKTQLVLKDEDGEQMVFVKSDPDSGK